MNPKLSSLLFLAFLINACTSEISDPLLEKVSLSGEWQFALDTARTGITDRWFDRTLAETVNLPGTLDENDKGIPNTQKEETMRLSRERTYEGWAWYSKEVSIPDNWKGKCIRLTLERTKPSVIWIDTIKAGTNSSILTSQVYELGQLLTPGKHTLTILVNNGPGSVPRGITGSHAWTEHTQTNWNGIIGELSLEAVNQDHIEAVKVYPDSLLRNILVKVRILNGGESGRKYLLKLRAEAWNTEKKHAVRSKSYPVTLKDGVNEVELTYNMGKQTLKWSEFDPVLYKLSVSLADKDEVDNKTVDFGMRRFSTAGTQFSINGITTFLRGKHDACVFPLTAHPPMDVDSWRRVFRIAKSYNINFYRFHSWTPPKAAFEAADIEGIYLQPELPFWGGFSRTRNTDLNDFLRLTGDDILREYGNHASFVMFALGNELSGDQQVMNDLLTHFKSIDNRHLMAYGSNNYLGFRGQAAGEDYYAGCRIGADTDTTFSTHIRASFSFADAFDGGYINGRYPSCDLDYSGAISKCTVPALGTEVGQYQIYPDYNEINKYKGVLKPWNFMVFRKRLEDSHLGDQAYDFFRASGALSVICYRADIEMALRTPGFGGFHLLDLQDFPGQGTALIGILDAFMESKGLITPAEFSHFCNKVVPLFVTGKYCWTNSEKLAGKIKIANYSDLGMKSQPVSWDLRNAKGETVEEGQTEVDLEQGKLTDAADLVMDLSGFTNPEKVTLNIKLDGTGYENSYSFWIYPAQTDTSVPKGVVVADKLDKNLLDELAKGGKVLLFPEHADILEQSVGGLFITDYWNYKMFKGISEANRKPVSPGTMGILTDPEHPIFSEFPTEFHSNWQWWAIVKKSRPMILDNTPESYKPVVQVIDNIERNHKLGLIFEFSVGKGKVLVCMSDLRSAMTRPEVRQLYISILKYMANDRFNPSQQLTPDQLKALFRTPVSLRQ